MAFDGVPITSAFLPPCGTDPQHLLFTRPEPDQTAFLPHHIQDAGDGSPFDHDVISQRPGGDLLEENSSVGPALGSISVWHSCRQ